MLEGDKCHGKSSPEKRGSGVLTGRGSASCRVTFSEHLFFIGINGITTYLILSFCLFSTEFLGAA